MIIEALTCRSKYISRKYTICINKTKRYQILYIHVHVLHVCILNSLLQVIHVQKTGGISHYITGGAWDIFSKYVQNIQYLLLAGSRVNEVRGQHSNNDPRIISPLLEHLSLLHSPSTTACKTNNNQPSILHSPSTTTNNQPSILYIPSTNVQKNLTNFTMRLFSKACLKGFF